ncbi:MAG: hypothetical protein V1755_07735, partial [Chloroflexota bacterium]
MKFCDMCGTSLKDPAAGKAPVQNPALDPIYLPGQQAQSPEQIRKAAESASTAGDLHKLYAWQLSLVPDGLDSGRIAWAHQQLSQAVGVLNRLKLGRGWAREGYREAVLALSEDIVPRAGESAMIAQWVAEVLSGAKAVDNFVKSAAGAPANIACAYARAFYSIGEFKAAADLLTPRQASLGKADWAIFVALCAHVDNALPLKPAEVPEDLKMNVAEALIGVHKGSLACDVLRGADRMKWGHREYLKAVRAWRTVNDYIGASAIFKEAMVRFKLEEAPHLYYEFARFAESMGELAEAKEIYKQMRNMLSTRCMVDAGTRLGVLEGLSIHESQQMNSVLIALKGGEQTGGDRKKAQKLDIKLVQGRYEVQEQIGIGGMGTVYRAKDKKLGRNVALKRIRDEVARQRH